GKQVGPAADVYALGAILYKLLLGQPPFQSDTPLDTLIQVVHADPTPPRRLRPDVPRDLESICLKCLEKAPSRRYPSAEALADDLRRFQAGESVRARPVGVLRRGGRWCRRRPVLTALIGIVLLTGAGALAHRASVGMVAMVEPPPHAGLVLFS